jgi:hypothetical protein
MRDRELALTKYIDGLHSACFSASWYTFLVRRALSLKVGVVRSYSTRRWTDDVSVRRASSIGQTNWK